MKKFIIIFLSLFLSAGIVLAQEVLPEVLPEEVVSEPVVEQEEEAPAPVLVNIEIKSAKNILNVADFTLADEGTASITDSEGQAHEVNMRSVLYVLSQLDKTNSDFKMGELIYYPAWSALYLRCMKLMGETLCGNWVYEVDGESPSVGMDNFILEGGEDIQIYYTNFFGTEPEPEEEVVEEERETSRSSGSSTRKKVEIVEVEEPEPAEEIVAVEPPAPLVPAYIAHPEYYTPEELKFTEVALADTETEIDASSANNLAAAVGESGANNRVTYVVASVLLLISLAMIAYKKFV
jgi:hypothetical protein